MRVLVEEKFGDFSSVLFRLLFSTSKGKPFCPIFAFPTILSNICLSIIFVSPKICGPCCITKNKLLHQPFGVLWYRGQVGTDGEGTLPCGITVCLCMLSLRDNNMGLGEGRTVLEENRVPESQVLCLHLEFQPEKQSQKIVPKLVMETLTCRYFQTCGS